MRRPCSRARGVVYGALACALCAGTVAAAGDGPARAAGTASPGGGPVLAAQSFSGPSVSPSDWISGGNGAPCLTAGDSGAETGIRACGKGHRDRAGHGALQLTGHVLQESGFVLYTKPLNARNGLNISFDMYQYDTTTKHGGADGIGFVLINGSRSPHTAGSPGGYMGYLDLEGAYLGVVFDEWGNFSNRALWGSGPDRRVPDSVVVRGAGSAGYPYIGGVTTPRLASDHAAKRAGARRHIEIIISTSGMMTVRVNFGHGLVTELKKLNLTNVAGQPALPATVKFGFTGATGDHTDIHQVSNLVITGLRPDLHTKITPVGSYHRGGNGHLTVTVSSVASSGPTTGPVTALIKVPGSLTPVAAAGRGWTCPLGGQEIRCTRPDTLDPGRRFPPIDVTSSIAAGAPATIPVSSSATTAGMYLSPGNASSAVIPVLARSLPPRLRVEIAEVTPMVAGGTGKVRLDVSNERKAGPTTGPVDLTYTAPADTQVISADGAGWTCAIKGTSVPCSRPDVLRPGHSYPPVYVTSAICHKARCMAPGAKAVASTPGSTADDTTDLTVTQRSSLGLSLTSNPAVPKPGYDTTFTAVITNGGPTDVENADLVVQVPPGYDGDWTCIATEGSGCPGKLPTGQLSVKAYVASGGTVTFTATGSDPAGSVALSPVSATVAPPATYIDRYCSAAKPCSATGNATAGNTAG
jgi:Bacterial lectin